MNDKEYVLYKCLIDDLRKNLSEKRYAIICSTFRFINGDQSKIKLDDILSKFKPAVFFLN